MADERGRRAAAAAGAAPASRAGATAARCQNMRTSQRWRPDESTFLTPSATVDVGAVFLGCPYRSQRVGQHAGQVGDIAAYPDHRGEVKVTRSTRDRVPATPRRVALASTQGRQDRPARHDPAGRTEPDPVLTSCRISASASSTNETPNRTKPMVWPSSHRSRNAVQSEGTVSAEFTGSRRLTG